MADILQWASPDDRHVDYCLWDYAPLRPPEGRLHSASLLWHSFDALGAPALLRAMVEALRAELGPGQIVWGVKQAGSRHFWELYFYDYARLERTVAIERVTRILAPFVATDLGLSPRRPYFMFSIELSDQMASAGRIEEISVYIGNPGSSVSSGLCYGLTAEGLRFTNLYQFFDAKDDRDDIVAKIAASARLDLDGLDIGDILWPELSDCRVIVVANKQQADAVYFSRISVGQLGYFLDRLDYPASIRQFLAEHETRFDHLTFDVGFDYTMVDGRIVIHKSAYYGFV